MSDLEKKWPTDYNRVRGQDKDKGVASKKQLAYMKAKAAEGDSDAKSYVSHSESSGDLPEEGAGRKSDKKDRKVEKEEKPKVATFQEQVDGIKAKYAEKKPKTFAEQVANVKAKYKNPLEKSSDLFYGKVEGILEKGCRNEELLSHLMDAELVLRNTNDEPGLTELYKSADRFFDAIMSKEEQVVYELSYLAKNGCEDSEIALAKFATEMHEEMLKNTPVEYAVAELVQKAMGKPLDAKAAPISEPIDDLTDKKKDKAAKSEDNSKVKGKANGASYRMVHGYKRYTSGPKRGEYVHRHEAEKRLGRKLSTKEHVDHVDGKRSGTKNTKVMSASAHSAKTNSTRAGKGYSGSKRYEHTRD